uniref:Methyltransferase type 11 domain-containing protein n=1 Tax=Vitis vinifera TaxID=29760 RepID=F6GWD0_VITVI
MSKKKQSEEELLQTLGDFTSKENWDKFFTIRGSDDSFEWYAEWPQLKDPLLSHLSSTAPPSDPASEPPQPPPPPLQILVPGCGNSRLSEHLYDAGFHGITNVDFSKVVISDMLRRNVRSRPDMRWRVMDITSMQFPDGSFDAILDKGGLDALMEPELGPKLGKMYLTEVKRVLKSGGKFIGLTLAESHVLGLLFSKFRFGWKMSIHVVSQKPSNKPSLLTFMVVAEKESSTVLHQITTSFARSSLDLNGNQARGLYEAIENENRIRREYSNGSDLIYSLEDLQLGAKGDLFQTRAHEWLFSSEEGQWMVVESSKAARLIMVTSTLTGLITVEDVVYENVDGKVSHLVPSKALLFRRLTFQRAEGLVQSEALLTREGGTQKIVSETERKKSISSSKSRKKGNQKKIDSLAIHGSSNNLKVYHNYLASSYHMGIISGFMLISSYLESVASTGRTVKAVVIGLGAGLLPMFLHGCMPFLDIEVVELDPVILNLARNYFGFCEDKHLKVHIADGIQFVRGVAADGVSGKHVNNDAQCDAECPSSNGSCTASHAERKVISKFDILIIDVDSSDSSSGMTCPAADFVDESFLLTVKDSLSDQGLFVVNLVSRSRAIKNMVVSRMKAVFSHLFCLQLEEDVNEVLFALRTEDCIKEEQFGEAAVELEKLLSWDRNDLPEKSKPPEMSQIIRDSTEKIKCLK